ncbi:hypothetical protein HNQ34_001780 [Anoxybacillus tepidamans]|uniref:Uncharacterized protein n=1 Tax=Anoxybacteroides tepidamans TaxID=265948 RepID=A0A7W8IRX5_9BACL|nr:hypothetical protein [Anoxybacillus tepidamans]MBB5324682.1 hypothetical protein [Anoxybacillus tepidamans]
MAIQLKDVPIRGAYAFFMKNKHKKIAVDLRYNSSDVSDVTTIGWTDRPRQVLFENVEGCHYLTVYFKDVSIELSEKDFAFAKDDDNTTLYIEPKIDPRFYIMVSV